MALKHSDIAEIIRLIDESTLDEVSLEIGDFKLEVRRRGTPSADTPTPSTQAGRTALTEPEPAPVEPPVTHAVLAGVEGEAPVQAPETQNKKPDDGALLATATRSDGANGLIEVRSPMVGTFYRRPSPDSDAFVEVGSEVAAGDALCLVEVMKLFTTLHAELAGRVVEVCVDDADLVEHDQVLFKLEPLTG